jgi:hypothetical protein
MQHAADDERQKRAGHGDPAVAFVEGGKADSGGEPQ